MNVSTGHQRSLGLTTSGATDLTNASLARLLAADVEAFDTLMASMVQTLAEHLQADRVSVVQKSGEDWARISGWRSAPAGALDLDLQELCLEVPDDQSPYLTRNDIWRFCRNESDHPSLAPLTLAFECADIGTLIGIPTPFDHAPHMLLLVEYKQAGKWQNLNHLKPLQTLMLGVAATCERLKKDRKLRAEGRDLTGANDPTEADTSTPRVGQSGVAHDALAALPTAVNAMAEGFAWFDADDRVIMTNPQYLQSSSVASEIARPRQTFAEFARIAAYSGEIADALGREEDWIQWRIERHIAAEGSIEIVMSDGRTLRVTERRIPDGGRVILCADISKSTDAERRLSEIISGARLCTWEYDGESNTTRLNDEWVRISGRSALDLNGIGQDYWIANAHPKDVARLEDAFRDVFAAKTEFIELEVKLRHNSGHWLSLLLCGRVSKRTRDGYVKSIVGVAINLTEIRNIETRLRAILDASTIGTWEVDHTTGRSSIDEQYAEILGYSLQELMPFTIERFEALVHHEDLPRIQSHFTDAYARDQRNVRHEFRMRHRDGRWIWILAQSKVLDWLETGRPLRETGVHIDITENRERESAFQMEIAARAAAEQRMADIAEVSDDWFWEQDDQGRFQYISQGFERTTGIPRKDLIGLSRINLTWVEPPREDLLRVMKSIRNREPYSGFIYKLERDHMPEAKWLRISGAPYFNASGEFAGYRGVGSDVTSLVKAREAARTASKAKSQFLANMSHELRTPMTGVLGVADMLSETDMTAEQRSLIDIIRSSGQGLLATLNDILDISRAEINKLTISSTDFVPKTLVDSVRDRFTRQAEIAGIDFNIQVSETCARLRIGDPHRITQVLDNLVSNAIKFTETGGVTVDMQSGVDEADNPTLDVCVTDTGIGMTPEQVDRVFNEFEQAEATTSRRYGGTGLGLTITNQLVTLMKGTIDLTSSPGQGTKVSIRLPAPFSTKSKLANEVSSFDLTGKSILFADDNKTNRLVLKAMLKRMNPDLTLVDDGRSAVAAYKSGAFDLLMLDISMPGMDGIEALAAIRAIEAQTGAPPVPALAVTANAMSEQIDEYLAAGFDGHLTKPYRKVDFIQAFKQFLAPSPTE